MFSMQIISIHMIIRLSETMRSDQTDLNCFMLSDHVGWNGAENVSNSHLLKTIWMWPPLVLEYICMKRPNFRHGSLQCCQNCLVGWESSPSVSSIWQKVDRQCIYHTPLIVLRGKSSIVRKYVRLGRKSWCIINEEQNFVTYVVFLFSSLNAKFCKSYVYREDDWV